MDGSAPDLLLKELRRIKWLLLLILLALLSLPVFLLYVGWEVAALLQDNQVEEEGGSVETTAKDFRRPGDARERFVHRPALDSPDKAGASSYEPHLPVERGQGERVPSPWDPAAGQAHQSAMQTTGTP